MISFTKKTKIQSLQIQTQKGFSLVEMIVVLTIFTIMTGTSLFNYNDYQDSLRETNIAQDIALTVRQAQVYGLSGSDGVIGQIDDISNPNDLFGVNSADDQGSGQSLNNSIVNIVEDQATRGVAFLGGSGDQKIIIFEDLDQNRHFDPERDRQIDERTITDSDLRMQIAMIDSDDDTEIIVQNGQDYANVTFQRPYPDAVFFYDSGSSTISEFFGGMRIRVSSREDFSAGSQIEISSIGRISLSKYENE